ncbi:uncharacterized protein PAC_14267 [Phialocephala subalpina]|uniref:Uncharacterized protein n=1 Tax=Phialocephala subalpina TaxID=576137 RepID=A0A1L7XH45_9HELO|nr:uncharacterized protein PAC_14267 [Phialocephala subalpina]
MAPIDLKITDKASAEEWIKSKLPLINNAIIEAVQDGRARVDISNNEQNITTVTTHTFINAMPIDVTATVLSKHRWKRRALDGAIDGFRRVWGESGPEGAFPDAPAVPSRPSLHHSATIHPRLLPFDWIGKGVDKTFNFAGDVVKCFTETGGIVDGNSCKRAVAPHPSLHHSRSIQPRMLKGVVGNVSKFFNSPEPSSHETTTDLDAKKLDMARPLLFIVLVVFGILLSLMLICLLERLYVSLRKYWQDRKTDRTFTALASANESAYGTMPWIENGAPGRCIPTKRV